MARADLNVSIIGGGIGGLAAAVALAQNGAQVRVFEQSPAIAEIGAGIQISPNGVRVLRALGMAPPGQRSEAVHLRDGLTGRRVLRIKLPAVPGFWLCHRADLIETLYKRAIALGVQITLNAKVSAIAADTGTIYLPEAQPHQANVIIGADGLHSVCRHQVLGHSSPFFTSQVAWRAVVSVDSHPSESQVHVLPGGHIVTYPLRGGTITNVIAVEERDAWTEESWVQQADPNAFRQRFAMVHSDLAALLDKVEQVHTWGLFRHPVAAQWSFGKLVLLGDAAHPTLPFLAQGAVLALEDAWVLTRVLSETSSVTEAFCRYETLRKARAHRAIAAANANAKNYHLRGLSRWTAHKGLRIVDAIAPSAMLLRYAWLYNHDVTT